MRQRAGAACSAAICDACTRVVSACKRSEPEYTIVLHWLQRILSKDGVAGRGGLAVDANHLRNKTDAIGLLLLQSTAGHERAGD
jgi:hypothetical protein